MIVATCLNPALDVTYAVDVLRPGEAHRVGRVVERAGGKGTNVARVLGQLGSPCVLVGPVGGVTGERFTRELVAGRVPHVLVPVAGETRRSVAVVAGSSATVFNEPGPEITGAEWVSVRDAVTAAAVGASMAVLSGSRPPGSPLGAYAELIDAVDVPVLLDADGAALLAALPARPDIVKVNAAEASAATGVDDPAGAAAALVALGARAAVVTLGRDGVLALVEGRRIDAALPRTVEGNPTGAGDALAAALAHGLANGASWPEALADVVAVSAAAVAVAHAGEYDVELARELRPHVRIEES